MSSYDLHQVTAEEMRQNFALVRLQVISPLSLLVSIGSSAKPSPRRVSLASDRSLMEPPRHPPRLQVPMLSVLLSLKCVGSPATDFGRVSDGDALKAADHFRDLFSPSALDVSVSIPYDLSWDLRSRYGPKSISSTPPLTRDVLQPRFRVSIPHWSHRRARSLYPTGSVTGPSKCGRRELGEKEDLYWRMAP